MVNPQVPIHPNGLGNWEDSRRRTGAGARQGMAGDVAIPGRNRHEPGVIILIVSKSCQSQKMGLFPFNPSLRDHGKLGQ